MISAVEKFLRTPEVENLPKKQQNAKKILLKSTLDFELEKHDLTKLCDFTRLQKFFNASYGVGVGI